MPTSFTSGGSLDLSQLDKALAGRTFRTSSSLTGRKAGATGSASTNDGKGAGDGKGQGYSILWAGGGSLNGRALLSKIDPKVPAWVLKQGLTLSVTVDFALFADGTIGGVALQQSCGYADVDESVIDAIHRWRFSPAEGALPIRGLVPYVIRPH
jgi:TonB family protein